MVRTTDRAQQQFRRSLRRARIAAGVRRLYSRNMRQRTWEDPYSDCKCLGIATIVLMDKPRHPKVIRTWKVERIRKSGSGDPKKYQQMRPRKKSRSLIPLAHSLPDPL